MEAADSRYTVRLEALSQRIGRRLPIAEQIAESIRDMIVAGDLNPGDRIVESREEFLTYPQTSPEIYGWLPYHREPHKSEGAPGAADAPPPDPNAA